MSKLKIAVDTMGGDKAPMAVVEGCIKALKENPNIELFLFGDEAAIENCLGEEKRDRIRIIHTSEQIGNDEEPTRAIKRKKDSSIVRSINFLKEGRVDALVSAGNTGALLVGGTLLTRRLKGVKRPALATFFPTSKSPVLLLDVGANVDCKPDYLWQFAKIGQVYYKANFNKDEVKVGLINNGTEEKKGNQLTIEAFNLLQADKSINFIGNVEAREIHSGDVDVLVCDGFVGNIILKYAEGLSSMMFSQLKKTFFKNFITKVAALLLKKDLMLMRDSLDYRQYGGAPLIGLESLIIKAHGSSDSYAFKQAILIAAKYIEADVIGQLNKIDFSLN